MHPMQWMKYIRAGSRDSDGSAVGDVDCGNNRDMLTYFAFIDKAGLCPIWYLLIQGELVSDDDLGQW